MREGWVEAELKSVCTLQRGFDLPKNDRTSGAVPLISSSGRIDFVADAKVAGPGVVTGRSGSIGQVHFVEKNYWPLNTTLYIKDFHGNYPRFIYYLLSSLDLRRFTSGAGVPTLNRNHVHGELVRIPTSIEEQKRIVAILDEAFTGIAAAVANTEKNLANTRELFESYLQTIFNRAYSKYTIASLSDLASDITDGDQMPPPKSADGVPFITIRNIDKRTQRIDFDNTFKVPPNYFDGLKHNRKPIRGDVLYTVTGSYGIPVVIDHDKAFCFQRHIGLIRPSGCLDSRWLYYLLMSPQITSQADEQATGTAQKTVSLKALRGFQVPEVPLDEQHDNVGVLNEISAETSRLESIYQQKLTALAELKQSLLKKAFSGELTADKKAPNATLKDKQVA